MTQDDIKPPTGFGDVIRMAEEGRCWVCGRTGFVKLSQHLSLKHGLRADDVRAKYGVSWTQPLCSPRLSEQCSEQRIRGGLGAPIENDPTRRAAPRRKQQQTRAAMAEVANRPEVVAALVRRNRDPEYNEKRAAGLRRSALAAEQRAKAREARWGTGGASRATS